MSLIGDAVGGAVKGAITALLAPLQRWLQRRQDRKDGAVELSQKELAAAQQGGADGRKIDASVDGLAGDARLDELRRQRRAAAGRE